MEADRRIKPSRFSSDRGRRTHKEFIMRYSPVIGSQQTITNQNIASPTLQIDQQYGYAIHAMWIDATLNGTVKLQASIDGDNWTDITGSTQTVSGPGDFMWNVNGAMYLYARAYFTWVSGSGYITFNSSTKGP